MIASATTAVYWPGIRKDILNHQTNCHSCLENSPSQAREPIQMTAIPERPFQIVCSDLFELQGRHYLVIVDRFSGFLHIYHSREQPTHRFLIRHLRDVFIRYGRPEQLETDGGPQYQSQAFKSFLTTWGVQHRISSPYYPQSNGRAELAVKTAKRLLRENVGRDGEISNDKVACAVLQYHNTPLQGSEMSPAQLLFGRALADFLPVNPKAYQLHPYWKRGIRKQVEKRKHHHAKLATRYNLHTRILPPLKSGQNVAIQSAATKKWDRSGHIVSVLPHRRYKIKLHDNGNITIRNRRFLKVKAMNQTARFSGPPSGPIVSTSHQTETREQENEAGNATHPTVVVDASHNNAADTRHNNGVSREPLALRRLRPHNQLGLKE